MKHMKRINLLAVLAAVINAIFASANANYIECALWFFMACAIINNHMQDEAWETLHNLAVEASDGWSRSIQLNDELINSLKK